MSLPVDERMRRLKDRFLWNIHPDQLNASDECWIWRGARDVKDKGKGEKGLCYGRFMIGKKIVRAHRFSYEAFIGPIQKGMLVCHTCDVPMCVNPKHLFLGTNMTNSDDKVLKGRHQFGTRHVCAKLTEDEVRAIRLDIRSHETIAKDYSVSHGTITGIKRGKTWKHIL